MGNGTYPQLNRFASTGNPDELVDAIRRIPPGSTSPGGPGYASDIIFRPGAPTAPPYYATWPEVETQVNLAAGAITVYFDASAAPVVVPANANLLGNGLITLGGASQSPAALGGGTIVTVLDGAQFNRVRRVVDNLIFEGQLTTPVFNFNPLDIMEVSTGSGFRLLAGSTSGFWKFAAQPNGLLVDFGALFDNTAVPAVPVIDVTDPGALLLLVVTDGINATPASIKGGGANGAILVHDSSISAASATSSFLTGFAPFVPGANDVQISRAEGTSYDDLLVAPPFIAAPPNAYNVQLALDAIKGLLPATASGRNVIVFDPSIPVSAGNVYKTWAEVQGVAATTRGPLTIEIYPNAILTAPGLNYPDGLKLTGVGFFGPNPTPIETDNSGWNMSADGLEIHNLRVVVKANGTAPFDGGNAGCETVLSGTTEIVVDATSLAPAFSFHGGAPGPDVQRLILRDQAKLVTPAGVNRPVNCFGNASLEVFAYDQAVVEDNAIAFGGIGTFTPRQGTGASFSPNQAPSLLPLGVPVMGTYVEEITPDPAPITITHNLRSMFCVVELYNNNNVAVPCDTSAATGAKVTAIDVNTVELDLSFFTADPGWHVVVRR